MRHTSRAVSLICIWLLCTITAAVAQKRQTVPVPEEVIRQLSRRQSMRELMDENGGPAKSLAAESLKLSQKLHSEIIVNGTGYVCGASMCPSWIFRKTAKGHKLILYVGYISDIKLRKTSTRGYRDLLTAVHDTAYDDWLHIYRFDGNQYRLKECFERHYRNEQGKTDGKLRPKIIRVKCNDD